MVHFARIRKNFDSSFVAKLTNLFISLLNSPALV
jgi:hypothetical protein